MALINPNSKKFKNGMAKLYGFGAAIVILGALFKLMDWPGAGAMLTIGLSTSWRFLGTTDTIAIGWLISGDPFIGLQIGFAEVITKMILYFIHEKIWYNLSFGLEKNNAI